MRAVLLHGFTGAPASFTEVVAGAGLAESAFAPLLPGHGSAPSFCATGRFDDAVDDLARRVPWAEPSTLFGYSMGARVALRLLVRHPHRFLRAVLVGAHPGLDDETARDERRRWEAGLVEALMTRGIAAFVDDWEALPVLCPVRAVPAERALRRRAVRLGHTARGLSHALAVLGLAAMPSTTSALARIEVPVTLVVGGDDTRFRALARGMAAHMPAAHVVEVPRCGHDVALEAPEALVQILGGHV
jgi:2-succinyl-6-hydroxy-2,4-cyclohexadiene-1-carboxylate synthase